MKNIIAVCLSCLVLLGCSRTRSSPEENLTFENGTTVHAQHRNGDALEGVHLVTEANGEKWTYEAKTGTISKGVDGMVQIVLFDVQADLGSKGLMHEDRMTMAFRKKDSNENLNTTVTTDLPKFTISASDLAVPAEVVTNSTPSSNQLTVSINLQFSNAKAEEFQKFTREHLNQQTQLVIGTKVVSEPFIRGEISGGQAVLTFSSIHEAQAIADSLNNGR